MKEAMNAMGRRMTLFSSGLLLLTCLMGFFYVHSYKEAIHFNEFPIPGNAINTKTLPYLKAEGYTWNSASEEQGLPTRYLTIIRLNGWNKIDSPGYGLGSETAFEKNGQKVEIVSLTDYFFLTQIDY